MHALIPGYNRIANFDEQKPLSDKKEPDGDNRTRFLNTISESRSIIPTSSSVTAAALLAMLPQAAASSTEKNPAATDVGASSLGKSGTAESASQVIRDALPVALLTGALAFSLAKAMFDPRNRTGLMPSKPLPPDSKYKLTCPMLARYEGEENWSVWRPLTPTVIRFTPEQLDAFKVDKNCKDGLLRYTDGKLIDTSDGKTLHSGDKTYIWIMHPVSGDMYAYPERVGRVHHSSAFHDVDPAAGGKIKIIKGELQMIDRLMGHNRPTVPHFTQAITELNSRGVKKGFDIRLGETPEQSEKWAKTARNSLPKEMQDLLRESERKSKTSKKKST